MSDFVEVVEQRGADEAAERPYYYRAITVIPSIDCRGGLLALSGTSCSATALSVHECTEVETIIVLQLSQHAHLSLINYVKTHTRFKRTLIYYDIDNTIQIVREIPIFRSQNDT